MKPLIAERAKERMLCGKPLDPVQNSAQGKTRDALAKVAGVSHDTIHKASVIAEKAKERQLGGLKQFDDAVIQNSGQRESRQKVDKDLAVIAGVSHNTQDL